MELSSLPNEPHRREGTLDQHPGNDGLTCPKCQTAYLADSSTCGSCGLIFHRFYAQIEDRFEADFRLQGETSIIKLWQSVLQNYEDEATHVKFIESCAARRNLEFAAQKYERINSVLNDDIACRMLRRIEAIASFEFEAVRQDEPRFVPPRAHLLVFLIGGFFIFLSRGGHQFQGIAIVGFILVAGLWAIRLAADYFNTY